jgi:HSP20 family protein
MLPSIMRRSYRPFNMSDFFNDDFLPTLSGRTNSMPAVNIREDEKNYFIDLAIPGMDKKDLKIDVNEDILLISSESKHEITGEKEGYKKKEFNYSSFCRNFYIPENVDRDKIAAGYKDGILIVSLPKQEEENKKLSRQISIS